MLHGRHTALQRMTLQRKDKERMNKHIESLRKYIPTAAAALLFAALLAQAPHAAYVFIRIGQEGAVITVIGGIVYAIALESATAYFVWNNKMRWAIAFAMFSIMHNIAYYMPESWRFDIAGTELTLRYIVSALLISASLPIAIAAFSHVHVSNKMTHKDGNTRKPVETPVLIPTSNTATPTPIAPPVQSGEHSEAVSATPVPAEQTGATSGQPEGAQPGKGKVSAAEKQTIINMKANGMKSVDIADQMQLNESTVRSIIRRASIPAVHTNGATKESA